MTTMSNARFWHSDPGTTRPRNRATRLRLEPLEDRRTPTVAVDSTAPGELLIGLQPGMSQSDIAGLYASYGLSELRNLDIGDKGLRLVGVSGTAATRLIPMLQHDPHVRYAEPNAPLKAGQVSNDPTLPRDFGLINTGQTGGTVDADIDADEAWNVTTGNDIVVGVIDTGVDYNHPDLAANMWHNPGEIPGNKKDDDGNGFVDDYYGYDFGNEDSDPMDDVGHGT